MKHIHGWCLDKTDSKVTFEYTYFDGFRITTKNLHYHCPTCGEKKVDQKIYREQVKAPEPRSIDDF